MAPLTLADHLRQDDCRQCRSTDDLPCSAWAEIVRLRVESTQYCTEIARIRSDLVMSEGSAAPSPRLGADQPPSAHATLPAPFPHVINELTAFADRWDDVQIPARIQDMQNGLDEMLPSITHLCNVPASLLSYPREIYRCAYLVATDLCTFYSETLNISAAIRTGVREYAAVREELEQDRQRNTNLPGDAAAAVFRPQAALPDTEGLRDAPATTFRMLGQEAKATEKELSRQM